MLGRIGPKPKSNSRTIGFGLACRLVVDVAIEVEILATLQQFCAAVLVHLKGGARRVYPKHVVDCGFSRCCHSEVRGVQTVREAELARDLIELIDVLRSHAVR